MSGGTLGAVASPKKYVYDQPFICEVKIRSLCLQIIPDFVSVLHFVEPFFAARLLAEREHLCSMSMHGKSKQESMLGIWTFK